MAALCETDQPFQSIVAVFASQARQPSSASFDFVPDFSSPGPARPVPVPSSGLGSLSPLRLSPLCLTCCLSFSLGLSSIRSSLSLHPNRAPPLHSHKCVNATLATWLVATKCQLCHLTVRSQRSHVIAIARSTAVGPTLNKASLAPCPPP